MRPRCCAAWPPGCRPGCARGVHGRRTRLPGRGVDPWRHPAAVGGRPRAAGRWPDAGATRPAVGGPAGTADRRGARCRVRAAGLQAEQCDDGGRRHTRAGRPGVRRPPGRAGPGGRHPGIHRPRVPGDRRAGRSAAARARPGGRLLQPGRDPALREHRHQPGAHPRHPGRADGQRADRGDRPGRAARVPALRALASRSSGSPPNRPAAGRWRRSLHSSRPSPRTGRCHRPPSSPPRTSTGC